MKHCTFTPVINKKANARLLSRRRESSPEQGALEDFLVPRAVKGSAPLKGTDPNAGDRTVYPKGFEKAVQRLREGGTPNKENVLLSERGPQKKSTPTPTVPKPFHFHVEERRRARQDSSEMERRADAPMVNPYEGEEADDKDNDPVVLLVDVELPEYCAPPDGESNVVRMAVRKTNSANLLTFYFSKKYKLNREDSVLLHHRLISEMSAL
ncbi:hypothetical protein AGDE_15688 [Angomonas deanei]|nr:hypothetical protein AGDE_15688 [Angomonas deanei]|eukprot:EPY18644.1 hypothetical protein AGDE_15688 [Angomonas deanei]